MNTFFKKVKEGRKLCVVEILIAAVTLTMTFRLGISETINLTTEGVAEAVSVFSEALSVASARELVIEAVAAGAASRF